MRSVRLSLVALVCLVWSSSGCDDATKADTDAEQPGVVKSGLGGPGLFSSPGPKSVPKVQPKAGSDALIGEDGSQQIVAPNQLPGQHGLIGEDGSQQIVAPDQLPGQHGLIGEDGSQKLEAAKK